MSDFSRLTPRAGRRGLLKATGVLAGAASMMMGATTVAGASSLRQAMPTWKPDPTFYPSPRSAMEAPVETLAYVVQVNPTGDGRPDMIRTVDLDATSPTYGTLVGGAAMPTAGDELHHFGWNACSSMLCPNAAHPHVERRYLIVPGLRSSNVHILDTKDDPLNPTLVRTITAGEIADRTGYARGHTVHCGPSGIYISALGAPDGGGPGGIFVLDHDTFDVLGRWEIDRGPQVLHYDFWWHLGHDTMVTSEWGTPDMVETGVQPELLLDGQYGHHLHFWNLRDRRHVQAIDLGKEHQITLELRPAHDPTRTYGFVNSVVSLTDLSSNIFLWYRRDDGSWATEKVITIPAEPASAEDLPPALQPFAAVPPLVTDIELSVDDQMLYVSCWGTGELRQYDVSDPFNPVLVGSVHLGGIVRRASHPSSDAPLNGGPQMVEVSRDGKRVYVTNSLYLPWDAQFYPDGIRGWMVKLDATASGMALDPDFFIDFGDQRPHQVRLQGGDASSDSYCFP